MTFKTQVAADLTSVFFNTDEFAEAATYTPKGGAARSINICFEEEDPAAQSPAPPGDSMTILVKYDDAETPLVGDVFTIGGVPWYLAADTSEGVTGGRLEGIWHIRVTRSARRRL